MNRQEIDRIARFLIDQIGSDAAPHAQENEDWCNASDDDDGAKDWKRIRRTIDSLRSRRPEKKPLKQISTDIETQLTPTLPSG